MENPRIDEVWKPFPDELFADTHEVSSLGRIRRSVAGRSASRYPAGLLLTPCRRAEGYSTISMQRYGRHKMFWLHRLVATAFYGPCPDGHECRHLDGDRSNNSASNLAWGTKSENMQDKKRHGTNATGDANGSRKHPERLKRGVDVAGSKVTEQTVRKIRALYGSGWKQTELAAIFKIRQCTISQIVRRVTWKHVA